MARTSAGSPLNGGTVTFAPTRCERDSVASSSPGTIASPSKSRYRRRRPLGGASLTGQAGSSLSPMVMHPAPLALLDVDGTVRVQAGLRPELCEIVRGLAEGARRCDAKQEEARRLPVLANVPTPAAPDAAPALQAAATPTTVDCFCGLRW